MLCAVGLVVFLLRIVLLLNFLRLSDATQVSFAESYLPDALNPTLTNLIANDTVVLNYNGSGEVLGENENSPKPHPLSPLPSPTLIEDAIFAEIIVTIASNGLFTDCSKYIAVHQILHIAAVSQPVDTITNILVRLCERFAEAPGVSPYIDDCKRDFDEPGGLGPYYAMLFSKMSVATRDMPLFCASTALDRNACELLDNMQIDEGMYFSPKPSRALVAPEPAGETLTVLHLSDFHLDPRFDIGSEANCSNYMCCRPNSVITGHDPAKSSYSEPASRFGAYKCDSSPDLALSAFTSMSQFFNVSDLAFTIFTGDIISHDTDSQLSRAYVSYEEEITFRVFEKFLPQPVYATLGNHDSLPRGFNTPHSLNPANGVSSNALSWNYDLVSSLWRQKHWLSPQAAHQARAHYGAYSTLHPSLPNLRIISLNSDFYYRANPFNFINSTNPDPSGILKWLSTELMNADAASERVWIIAHVPPGHSNDAMHLPTSLFYSIINRFSPFTIAALFFGHTHMDQLEIFYQYAPSSLHHGLRNTTKIDLSSPLNTAFIGPSITPLTGLNSGYRLYEIDVKTYQVMNYHTYIANISNSLNWTLPDGPVWEHEYSARETYRPFVRLNPNSEDLVHETWPENAPLNATFFHLLTQTMLEDSEKGKVAWEMYTRFETKSSAYSGGRGYRSRPPSTIEQRVCEIRSGSGALVTGCKELKKEMGEADIGSETPDEREDDIGNGARILPWLRREHHG
jgi:sphingomyelin phosphodiesterase